VGRGERIGFLLGPEPAGVSPPGEPRKLRPVGEFLDEGPATGEELWGLAGWIGRTFLCGTGEALQLVCPAPLLKGAAVPAGATTRARAPRFRESVLYNPLDGERFTLYRERLAAPVKVLVLFSEVRSAAAFFAALPPAVRDEAILWPPSKGKKLWDAWKAVRAGSVRAVIGAPSAVFAPLDFGEVIVDDEASPGYVFVRAPRVSARSLAGRRALSLGAALLLGGRMPSAKTYLRSRPVFDPSFLSRKNEKNGFVFVDLKRSIRAEARGVEGELPVTGALIDRTRAALESGRHALWVMDRKGEAGEVACSDCGGSLSCPKCGSLLRSGRGGRPAGEPEVRTTRCVRCGAEAPLPSRCPRCRGTLLVGKRPGLEALFPLAARLMRGHPVFLEEFDRKTIEKPGEKSGPASLILGTRRILSLCDSLDAALAAWLDLDAESRRIDYNARFQTFSMVWESYWRGRAREGDRTVLLQTRRPESAWLNAFRLGWGYFWDSELRERKNLGLPPYELLVQMDLPPGEDREALAGSLEREGLPATSGGEPDSPLWLTARSTDRVGAALAPRFEIRRSRAGFPVVTVWSE
jgi:primosomal protein N' (replication factor Y)